MSKHATKRIVVGAAFYLVAYCVASYLDLATTALAVMVPGVHERNVFAVDTHGYAANKAWITTGIGAVAMEIFVVFSLRHAAGMGETWLQYPMRSFAKFYWNPWSKRVRDRSPLHMLSFALAFVALRVLAAANNLLLCEHRFAPLGALVGAVGAKTSPLVGFCLVIITVFYLLAILISPLAAALIKVGQIPTMTKHGGVL